MKGEENKEKKKKRRNRKRKKYKKIKLLFLMLPPYRCILQKTINSLTTDFFLIT
jgi:hypothetical protein